MRPAVLELRAAVHGMPEDNARGEENSPRTHCSLGPHVGMNGVNEWLHTEISAVRFRSGCTPLQLFVARTRFLGL